MMPILSAPVGKILDAAGKPKSDAHANKPPDVQQVQRLLNKVACNPRVPEDGKLSDAFISAIADFQSSWMSSPDGKIDVGGTTLRRLAYLANGPWTIKHVKKKKIEKGGYCISFAPAFNWTRNYRTYLTLHNSSLSPNDDLRRLGELKYCVDISGHNPSDILNSGNLPEFLATIEEFGESVWGNTRYCAIYIARGDVIVGRSSNVASIVCPVRPLSGEPDVIMPEKDTLPYYHGDGAPLVTPTPINDQYWFRYAGEFCTDNAKRGLNCCTYPAAVYGLVAHTDSGEHIADAIAGDTDDAVAGGSYSEMMTFLTKNQQGTYLMWYDYTGGGHVVLVVDGEAHEWSQSAGHYKHTSIPTTYDDKKDKCLWGSKTSGKYWVREL